ncbi:phage tail protein [Chryseobacterium defluvii]|nr:phage tail protein [Chryseobacterium defluvii]
MSTTPTPGAGIDLNLLNLYKTVTIKSIGNFQLALYKNDSDSVFFTPFIFPDWNKFEESLKKLDKNSTEIQKIVLRISFYTETMIQEIKSQLSLLGDTFSSVSVLPHTFFTISVILNKRKVYLNTDDLIDDESGQSANKKIDFVMNQNFIIEATYSELSEFYNTRSVTQINAKLHSDGYYYSTESIKALASFFNDTKIRNELTGDETLVDKLIVTSEKSGKGAAMNLFGSKKNSSDDKTIITKDNIKQRYVNRQFLAEFFSRYEEKLQIKVIANDIESKEKEIDKILDRFLKLCDEVIFEINKKEDDNWELVSKQLNYVTSIPQTTYEELLKVKPFRDNKVKDDANVKVLGNVVDVDVKKDGSIVTSDDIEWKKSGTEFIPTKVKMFIISDSTLNKGFNTSLLYIDKDGARQVVTEFIYPADWCADNSDQLNQTITNFDNPVGSILPYAGVVNENISGWLLCDGSRKNIDDYSALFNAIGYSWGKGKDDTEFKLPDLRGQFLRGVDFSGNVDPDYKTRNPNGLGISNEVGSFQSDTIQNITGEINGIHSDQKGNSATNVFNITTYYGNGDGGENRGCFNVRFDASKVVRTSTETRPKNAYVNYIIRAF